ncbi:MAG: hypothetical protein M1822_007195 [Bathelium mastoideum]|nr:MAG: hypothetical protein M1822_007195 [Bathelium mastoideum]
MKRQIAPRQNSGGSKVPLIVTNWCAETIYPGITTQGGTSGPSQTGFELQPGNTQNMTVSADWQGRVWGRTNCSFNSQGNGPANGGNGGWSACQTGDCNAQVSCSGAGAVPVTLAEFTMDGGDGKTYYDISLVDGYNLPIAIVLQAGSNSSLQGIPPNVTNPSCVASVGNMNPDTSYWPYSNGQATFLNTNSTSPLPFDTTTTASDVSNWCPWDLQVSPPSKPGDGVYPYPDSNIARPPFNPCFSACAKYRDDSDCCTGNYNSPQKCQPGDYSKAAKGVCPDVYSYAYDDQTSTFITPAGAGFEVIFCPGARSTNILSAESSMFHNLGNGDQANGEIGETKGDATTTSISRLAVVCAVVAAIATAALFSSL